MRCFCEMQRTKTDKACVNIFFIQHMLFNFLISKTKVCLALSHLHLLMVIKYKRLKKLVD